MKLQINGPLTFNHRSSYQVILNDNCPLQIEIPSSDHELRDLTYRIMNIVGPTNYYHLEHLVKEGANGHFDD